MKPVQHFEEFIKNNIVKEQTPDRSRANFLINESELSYNLLNKKIDLLGISDQTANDLIKSCYDIIMQLIRAKMLLDGYNASGLGAHEAEVSYMRELGFEEKEVQFTNQLRYYRNGMLYYGKILDKEYAQEVIKFTKRLYKRLRALIEKNKDTNQTQF